MPKILHLAHDEKFITAADDIFERAYPKGNTFFILSKGEAKIKFVDVDRDNYEMFTTSELDLVKISARLDQYDLVVLHWLDKFKCKLILRNDSYKNFLWMFWGGEIYDDDEIYPFTIIGADTRALLGRNSMIQQGRRIYKWVVQNLHRRRMKYSLKLAAIDKLALVGISNIEEASYFKDLSIINARTKPIRFFYYQDHKLSGVATDLLPDHKNILVGNSAAFTNNHLEVFKLLATIHLNDQDVFVPLGYSDNDGYVANLGGKAKYLLGSKYKPLHDFLDMDTYQNTIQNCGFAIFNHLRQQALGTILMSFKMGLRVFLNENGRNYLFFKKAKFHFHSIDELVQDHSLLNRLLSPEERKYNKNLVQEMCSVEKIVRELRFDLDDYTLSKNNKAILN